VILRPIVGPPASTSAAPPPMLPDAGKEKSHLPLRIDPVTCPAVIEIAEITLKDPGSNKILWSATAREEFTACKILGTAARLPHDRHLRILSFGGDPQLLLPPSTAG